MKGNPKAPTPSGFRGAKAHSALAYYLQMREEESTDDDDEELPPRVDTATVKSIGLAQPPADKLHFAALGEPTVEQRPGLSWSAEEEAHLEVRRVPEELVPRHDD